MRRLAYLLPVLLFALVAGYFLLSLSEDRDPSLVPSALIGKPMPAFTLPGLSAEAPPLESAAILGEPAVINLFASWCLPCRAEHPLLAGLAKDSGVALYGILYKDDPAAGAGWLAELGDPFRAVGVDRAGRTGIDFGAYGVPETYVIDREGIIRFRQVGPLDPQVIAEKVLPLLKALKE